jgi:hypothetical protein
LPLLPDEVLPQTDDALTESSIVNHQANMKPTISHIAILSSSVLTLVFSLLVSPLVAQTVPDSVEVRERFQAQIEESFERLELTGEQIESVRPIMDETFSQRLAVLEKHGVDMEDPEKIKSMGLRKKRKMSKDMEKVRTSAAKQLESVLTADQMDEWKKLEEERRARLREQMKNGG